MKYINLVLKRPVSAALLIMAVVVFGVSAIFGIQLEYFPDLEMPMEVVYVVFPGADADNVERLVVEPIEDIGEGLTGIDNIASESHENYATIQFTYEYGTDLDDAYSELKERLDNVELPENCNQPTIMEVSLDADATITVAAESVSGSDILGYVNDTVVPELEGVAGVAEVSVSGSQDEYFRIVLDETKMRQYGLTFSAVGAALSGADFDMPLGTISNGSQDVAASARTEMSWVEDLTNLGIQTSTGAVVRMGDVTTYLNLYKEEADSISRYNGRDSVLIDVNKKSVAATMSVCGDVEDTLEALSTDAVEFEVIHSSADDIMDTLMEVLKTLVEGVCFTMLVLWLFFGDLRASLIVGASMPLSLLAAMALLNLKGLSFDLMGGTGMIIAIGMIVDNSIVILESCFRAQDSGIDHRQAALQGASAMLMSVFASTLTTVVVYAPLTTSSGMSGQMNQPLCWTVIFTMVSSLLSAITVVPLLFTFAKPKEKKQLPINRVLDKLGKGYRKIMTGFLKRPAVPIVATLAMFVVAIGLATQLVFDLFPASYDGSIKVDVTFRAGTRLEVMDERIQSVEQALLEDSNFDSIELSMSENEASITAYSAPDCRRSSEEAVAEYTELFGDMTNMDVSVTPSGVTTGLASLMSTGNTVEVTLLADDQESLEQAAGQVAEAMTTVPGVIKVDDPFSQKITSVRFIINQLRATYAGLTPSSVAGQLYMMMNGYTAASINFEGDDYDVKLEYPEGLYDDTDVLLQQAISDGSGGQVALSDLVDLQYTSVLQSIHRQDGQFTTTVTATTTTTAKYSATSAINALVGELSLPAGASIGQSAIDKQMGDEMTNMGSAIMMAIFLVFMVMAIQFESIKLSLMVMLCIPFSLIGSFGLLFVTGTPISMMALMGILMLIGMVVNNGILLVDGANELKQSLPLKEALIQAGLTRLRPILMTTLTTVLSMLPMVLSSNSGMEMMRGMGFVIIGGLCTSTILAMFLMPPFYLLFGGPKKPKKEKKRRSKKREEPQLDEGVQELPEAPEAALPEGKA